MKKHGAYPQTFDDVLGALPDSCQNLTSKQIADILKAIHKAYHDGRKSAGAEVDSEAVWVAALKELYPFEILKRLKKKELWVPRRDNSGKDRVEVWEYVDTVGEKIKHFREAAGLTQQQLAEKLGVTKNLIWQWEHGYRIPKPETREKIALALDKDPWVFY